MSPFQSRIWLGGSRLHHLAGCLLAATSHCPYPSNQFRRRALSGKASVPAGDLWSVCVRSCVRVCVCAGIMDECCRYEHAGSVLEGRSISTIHSSLITAVELRGNLSPSFSFPPSCYLWLSLPLPFFHDPFERTNCLLIWKKKTCVTQAPHLRHIRYRPIISHDRVSLYQCIQSLCIF